MQKEEDNVPRNGRDLKQVASDDLTNVAKSVEIKKPVYQWFTKEKLSLSTSPGMEKFPPTPYGTPC